MTPAMPVLNARKDGGHRKFTCTWTTLFGPWDTAVARSRSSGFITCVVALHSITSADGARLNR